MGEQRRARGRVAAWDGVAGAPRAAASLRRTGPLAPGLDILRDWVRTETAPGRLVPFMAVAFGGGILVYFAATAEPDWRAALALAALVLGLAWAARRRPVALPLLLGCACVAAGFAAGAVKARWVAHPVLAHNVYAWRVTGFVEMREERERSDRIVVRVMSLDAGRNVPALRRLRVAVKRGTAPPVGAFVEFKARLMPPLQPLMPGGYDFARDMYFRDLAASGFVLGPVRQLAPPQPGGAWLAYAAAVQGLRDRLDARIRAVVPGDAGAIASALITGKRDAISAPVNEAMYVSSLAHVLSISGYHMAVVSGLVFFLVRAALALVPLLAGRRPIKKWAAAAALVAATFYLLLSGAEVATQRSYVMVAVVLGGIICDRRALTLRTITIAAFAVLFLTPEAIVHPSFQMSFAATLALIAIYERNRPGGRPPSETPMALRFALWGGREIVALILASLVAGLATTPFAAYHFHRAAPYGVLANLLAMPVISAWVMPAGLVGLLALPFGFDSLVWPLMGYGIDWMVAVALFVARLPGVVGQVTAFGPGPLILGAQALVLLCLLRSPLRYAGIPLALAAMLWAGQAPRPDLLVAGDGRALAVRLAGGRLSVARQDRDQFQVRQWLAADADPRSPQADDLGQGIACDPLGCIATLPDGKLVALLRDIDAVPEDCRRAAIVVSALTIPGPCAAMVIDRPVLADRGALALRRVGDRWLVEAARPPGTDRPWAPAPAPRAAPRRPDATPAPADLEPDDVGALDRAAPVAPQ